MHISAIVCAFACMHIVFDAYDVYGVYDRQAYIYKERERETHTHTHTHTHTQCTRDNHCSSHIQVMLWHYNTVMDVTT